MLGSHLKPWGSPPYPGNTAPHPGNAVPEPPPPPSLHKICFRFSMQNNVPNMPSKWNLAQVFLHWTVQNICGKLHKSCSDKNMKPGRV